MKKKGFSSRQESAPPPPSYLPQYYAGRTLISYFTSSSYGTTRAVLSCANCGSPGWETFGTRDPPNPREPRPAPPHPTPRGQIPSPGRRPAAQECGRAAGTRRIRRGRRAGRGATAARRRGCSSRCNRPQKTTKAQAVFFGRSLPPRPTQRASLGPEREPLSHPPVPSWISPRLPVRFPVHFSRQEVPGAATVAPQLSDRRRRSSSRAGQTGLWCLAAVSGPRPGARHPSGLPPLPPPFQPRARRRDPAPIDPDAGDRGLRNLLGWAKRVDEEALAAAGPGPER